MGTTYLFVCDQCKYHSKVSGGEDCGFLVKTKTMVCNDCKTLVDVSTEFHAHVKKKERFTHDIPIGNCPKCQGSNVSEWCNPGPCPKCAGMMVRKEAVANWD